MVVEYDVFTIQDAIACVGAATLTHSHIYNYVETSEQTLERN